MTRDAPEVAEPAQWAPASSEMAARIRDFDWSTTALGPIEGWPQSLRFAVEMMLASPMLASLAVGPQRLFLYNDEAARHYGNRHPGLLGRPLAAAFAHEFEAVEPFYDRVSAGESVHVPAQPLDPGRTGTAELFDAYLMPVRDADGAVIAAFMTGFAIGDRVKADARLRESEARHRLLIGSVAQVVWETDADGVVIADSPTWRAYTGQTLEEWLGYGWLDAIHPEDRAYAERQWREATGIRGLVDAEFRLRAPDGGWRWTNVRAAPVLDETGTVEKWAGMNIDIDDRRKTETALRESEERQAFLLRLTDALRLLTHPADIERSATRLLGEHLKADRCFLSPVYEDGSGMCVREEYLRAGASSVLGDYTFAQLGDFVGPELHAGRILAVENVDALTGLDAAERASYAATEIGAYLLIPLVRNGRLAAFLTINHRTPRPWSDADKAVARQTADRLWTARERARAETALRESEAKYRTLFETMEEGYGLCEVIRDSAGQVIDWRYLELNPALERHSGMDVQTVVGRVFSELFPDTDRSYWLGIYQTVMDTQSSRSFEDYWAPIDRWIAGEASPAGGERFYVIYRDVTERKRAELALRESEERQAFLLKLSDALRPLTDVRDIKAAAAAVASEWLDIASAGYAEVEAGGLTSLITDEYNDGRIPSLTARYTLKDFSSVTEPMQRGETIHFADLDDDNVSPDTRAAFAAINVHAAVATPLIKNGVMVAYVFVAHPEPRAWAPADLEVLREVAERTWAAVERARAETALRDSESLRRVALTGGRMGAWRWDLGAALIWGDAQFWTLWGYPPSDDPRPLSDFNHRMSPESAAHVAAVVASAIEGGEQFDGLLEVVAGPNSGHWLRWQGRAADDNKYMLHGVTFDITEQKQAEQVLRESEERQAFLLELSDALRPHADPVAIQDIAARILGEHLDVDRTYYAVVQGDYEYAVVEREYRRGDAPSVVGTHAFATFGSAFDAFRDGRTMVVDDVEATDVIRSEDLAGFRALSIRSLINTPLVKNGRSVAGVTVLKMTPHKWTAQQVSLVEAVAERTWAAVERARAEAALRESEQRFRTLADTAPAFIWFNDDVGANVFVNQAFLNYTGRSAEQVAGERWHGLLHPDQEQSYVASYLEAVRTQTPFRGHNLLRRADGVWHWCDNYARPLFRDDGSYRGHVGVLIDVDDKVRAEERLRESEARYHALFAASPVPFMVLAPNPPDFTITAANDAYLVATLTTREGLIGRRLFDVFTDDPNRQGQLGSEALAISLDRVLSTRRTDAMERVRYDIVRPDGRFEPHWWLAINAPLLDANGEITAIIHQVDRQTELHLAEEAKQQYLARQNVLVAELQHRTRNLMGVVRSMADTTMRSSTDLEDFEARFRDKLAALARVQGLLSRLAETDRVTFDELLRTELVAHGGLGHEERRVSLKGPAHVALRSSTVQTLAMAIHELATNAVKYGALGQPQAKLAVHWRLGAADKDGRPRLLIDWRESKVRMPPSGSKPLGIASNGSGHGRELIEQALPYQLGAETSFVLGADGVHCTISMPASATTRVEEIMS